MAKDLYYYKVQIKNMKRRHKKGALRPNKVVLMLAVCERVAEMSKRGYKGTRMLTERNLIDLNPRLEELYYEQWNQNIPIDPSQASDHYFRTFGAMDEESFWKLHLLENGSEQDSYTEKNLVENYEGAIVDHELIDILLNEESRAEIQNLLLSILLNEKKQTTIEPVEEVVDIPPTATLTSDSPREDAETSKKAFIEYLYSKGKSDSSVRKYAIQAFNHTEVKKIVYKETGKNSLYEIDFFEEAQRIHKIVQQSQFDNDGHNMYSVALHHYCDYLETKNQGSEITAQRPWEKDEMILALDLYLQLDFNEISANNPSVKELADILKRSYKSIAARLFNYEYLNTGSGLSSGYGKCKPICDSYAHNRNQLIADASAIYSRLGCKPIQPPKPKITKNDQPTRNGQPWESYEDWVLTEAYKAGEALSDETVNLLQRTKKAIIYQLKNLGLISQEQRDDMLRAYLAEQETKEPVKTDKETVKQGSSSLVDKYKKQFLSMHRAPGANGTKAPHKVILMLTILGLYRFKSAKQVPLYIKMLDIQMSFSNYWQKYVNPATGWTQSLSTPWEHMISEPFWHVCKDTNKGCYLDEDLQKLLVAEKSRKALKETLLTML